MLLDVMGVEYAPSTILAYMYCKDGMVILRWSRSGWRLGHIWEYGDSHHLKLLSARA